MHTALTLPPPPPLGQDFWFTAGPECVPGGPAFDYTYYNTYTWVVGAFTGWVGIVVFQATMSGWTFRSLFWVTTVIQCVAAAFDLLLISRWNVSVGISDKVREGSRLGGRGRAACSELGGDGERWAAGGGGRCSTCSETR